jgi:hypothetical protein
MKWDVCTCIFLEEENKMLNLVLDPSWRKKLELFDMLVACMLTSHNLTVQDAYTSFVIHAEDISIKHGFEHVNW